MLRKDKFAPDEHYHVYNRVIFNMPEFSDKHNAEKLMQAFLIANSTKSSEAFEYLRSGTNATFEKAVEISQEGEKFVDILAYSIMPDHYHLLVKERREKGVTQFIHKCNISISKYVNTKTQRKGPLFDGLFRAKHISSNEYLLHLSVYIHLNPLDFIAGKEWRSNSLKNWQSAKTKLLDYPWSSLKHYLSRNFKDRIVSGEDLILSQFANKDDYERFLREWVGDTVNSMDKIGELSMD